MKLLPKKSEGNEQSSHFRCIIFQAWKHYLVRCRALLITRLPLPTRRILLIYANAQPWAHKWNELILHVVWLKQTVLEMWRSFFWDNSKSMSRGQFFRQSKMVLAISEIWINKVSVMYINVGHILEGGPGGVKKLWKIEISALVNFEMVPSTSINYCARLRVLWDAPSSTKLQLRRLRNSWMINFPITHCKLAQAMAGLGFALATTRTERHLWNLFLWHMPLGSEALPTFISWDKNKIAVILRKRL